MPIRTATSLLLALALALSACSEESPTSSSPSPSATPAERPRFDPERVALATRVVAQGLEAPVGLAHAGDGSDRLYVVEQPGRIRSFAPGGAPQLFLDIADRISSGGERGLLGLAFHPRFERNDRFFVNYTDVNGDTVISEFTANARGGDPLSERVLLTVDQPYPNHNGGDLAFGRDGFLYVALGDGGSAGDPHNNGQRLDTLLGKMLRIDVDARGAGTYGIPPDNPFVDSPDARPEIWAYGLRNPWQFSFDRDTDDLWIADVGQGAYEEINREPAGSRGGLNYGWNQVEGVSCYAEGCDPGASVRPVAVYSHDQGCAVTGGYVYRGSRFPQLVGAYVAGDYCSGNIWVLPPTTKLVQDPRPALETDLGITSFGEDESGELYLTDVNAGTVRAVIAGS